MIFETDFMKLYEELNEANADITETFDDILDELKKFDYAFIDKDGKELPEDEAMKAYVQSPEQLADLGKGVCTDFVEYTRAKLDDLDLSYSVYDIKCTDKDGDNPAHVFVVVEANNKFYWIEAAWHSEAGIHEYDDILDLFEDIARKHCIYDGENYLESCEIREIEKSLVGMSQDDIYDYVETLPIAWKAAEEGLTEGLETLEYKEVSDVELFKEYAYDILDGYGGMSDAAIKNDIKEIHLDGKLAGYIGFSEYEENGHKCLGIGNFMVIERGKGLGSAVIQDIVAKHKNQYDLIYCFVDAKNEGAIRLYKKLGKVYDEEGPNDNGEYYVTFYDNGNWELNEGKKNKQAVVQEDPNAQAVKNILAQHQLIPISDWVGGSKVSETGWTVLVPANKITTFEKETVALDVLISRELVSMTDSIDIYGRPARAKGNILNNGKRYIAELDFGTYVQRNQWRGLGFTVSYKNYKYFILGYIFTKKRQKIDADDSEVKAVNRLYDSVVPAFKNLK